MFSSSAKLQATQKVCRRGDRGSCRAQMQKWRSSTRWSILEEKGCDTCLRGKHLSYVINNDTSSGDLEMFSLTSGNKRGSSLYASAVVNWSIWQMMKRLRCADNKPQLEVWCLFLKILVGTARERKKAAVAGATKMRWIFDSKSCAPASAGAFRIRGKNETLNQAWIHVGQRHVVQSSSNRCRKEYSTHFKMGKG